MTLQGLNDCIEITQKIVDANDCRRKATKNHSAELQTPMS